MKWIITDTSEYTLYSRPCSKYFTCFNPCNTHTILWSSYYYYHVMLYMRKLKHGDFKLRWGRVRLQSSCSWQLFYSSLLSCENGFQVLLILKRKDVSERKKNCKCRVQVVMRKPWPPSLCLFMEEFILNFEDSMYYVEAEEGCGKEETPAQSLPYGVHL